MSTAPLSIAKPFRSSAGDVTDIEARIRRRYCAIRTRIPTLGVQVTLLHIGAEATEIVTGNDLKPEAVLALNIGSDKTARDHFKRNLLPTPVELENAIATIEDEVARARTIMTRRSTLFTTDDAVRQIALIAGVSECKDICLSLDAVEQTFGRLVSVSLGRSPVSNRIPQNAGFAASLLILREFMHHMQFTSINVAAQCS